MISEVDILLIEDSLDDAEMTLRALKKINLDNKFSRYLASFAALVMTIWSLTTTAMSLVNIKLGIGSK